MFEAKSSTIHRLARYHPLFGLLVPLCLAPLSACANDVYLAQNYQTTNPGYQQPTYNTQPPGYAAPVANGGQFLAPPQLAELVNRIALYPDDLIGIILPASTFPLQIVQAARYLDAVRSNSTLAPDDAWDNSVVALLNYPDVVNMMDRELDWTEHLGQAVVVQQADVIAAIGQFRAQAQAAGNLRSDERQVVDYDAGAIRIRPANPQVIYVPQYEPTRVVVYQSEPVFAYYPRPCPVYYYNYASGYPSGFSNFWGVSTMFTIGWSNRSVRLHDYDYYDDPRFDRPYNGYFYRRSHHDWDDDGDRRWSDNDHHDSHGGGERPREHDWQPHGGKGPRPIAVGNGGQGRDQGDQGGHGSGRGAPRDRGAQSGNFMPAPVPRRMQTQDSESSVRREVRPLTTQQRDAPAVEQPGSVSRTPRIIAAPDAPAAMGIRRSGGFESDRNELRSAPDNPAARFSAPTPRRVERDINVPRLAPVQPSSMRTMPDADEARGNGRLAPSRVEPRAVPRIDVPSRAESRDPPSRQEMRAAPNRPESRAPAASPRNSDGPASVRHPSDDDRGRDNRDR